MEKPYILVAKNNFELHCNGWELFLALKVLFNHIKKKPNEYDLLCRSLVKCGAFEYKEVNNETSLPNN